MTKAYEEDLEERWATAQAGLEYSRMINVYGRSPVELAKIKLLGERAQLAFDEVDKELIDYARR